MTATLLELALLRDPEGVRIGIYGSVSDRQPVVRDRVVWRPRVHRKNRSDDGPKSASETSSRDLPEASLNCEEEAPHGRKLFRDRSPNVVSKPTTQQGLERSQI